MSRNTLASFGKLSTALCVVLSGMVAMGTTGCKKAGPETATYWEKLLEKEKTRRTALVKIGDDAPDQPQREMRAKVVVKFFDKDPGSSCTALRKLGVGTGEVIDVLEKALASKDPSVMPTAAEALRVLNGKKAENALVEILAQWTTPNQQQLSDVRVQVIRALAAFETKAAVPGLMAVANAESNTKVARYEALNALAHLGDARAIPALLQGLYTQCALDRCSAVSRVGLARIGKAAVPAIMKAIAGQDPAIQKLAKDKKLDETQGQVSSLLFLALGDVGDASVATQLAAKYLDGEPSMTRAYAISAIGYTGTPAQAAALQSYYEKPTVETRTNILHALHRIGARSAVPFLTEVIEKGEDPNLVWNAGLALSYLGTDADLGVVTATLGKAKGASKGKGEDADIAKQTVKFYEQFAVRLRAAKGCKDDACWIGKLKDQDKEVRTKAARMLALSKDKGAAEAALIGALADPDNDVREELAFALGKVGSAAKSVPALKARLTEDKEKTKLKPSLFQYELIAARLQARGA